MYPGAHRLTTGALSFLSSSLLAAVVFAVNFKATPILEPALLGQTAAPCQWFRAWLAAGVLAIWMRAAIYPACWNIAMIWTALWGSRDRSSS